MYEPMSKEVKRAYDKALENKRWNEQECMSVTENKKKQKKKADAVVNEYLDVLQASWGLVEDQEAMVKKAIELRMFGSVIQKLLEDINTSGTLTPTIEAVCKMHREFDVIALESGPYKKEDYIRAVLQPFMTGDGNA